MALCNLLLLFLFFNCFSCYIALTYGNIWCFDLSRDKISIKPLCQSSQKLVRSLLRILIRSKLRTSFCDDWKRGFKSWSRAKEDTFHDFKSLGLCPAKPLVRTTFVHWLFLMIIQIFYWCLRPKIKFSNHKNSPSVYVIFSVMLEWAGFYPESH